MKKIVLAFVLISSLIALAACAGNDNGSFQKPTVFTNQENVIGFSALSSVLTLHNHNEETFVQSSNVMRMSSTVEQVDPLAVLAEIKELTPYLNLISTFMGSHNTFAVAVIASDNVDYDYQMIISTMSMKGEPLTYTMYYNETIIDEDEEDEEYESILEGIMVIDAIEYTVLGEREIDENEETLYLIAKLDDENYVTFEYEIESEGLEQETKFVYEMFVNNQLVKRIEIEFEEDNEETELTLKFLKSNRESEYSFEIKFEDGKYTIEIEYKITENGQTIEEGEVEVSIYTDPDTGETVVRYEIEHDGYKIIVDDDYDDDDDDDDEEDNDDDDFDDEDTDEDDEEDDLV